MRRAFFWLVLLTLGLAVDVRGEVFVLKDGGKVVGELLNPDQSPRETFVVKTSTGGEITLRREQVEQVLRPRPEEREYERLRPTYPDTAEGQWALAQWCLAAKLSSQRRTHLERVIELDPQHAEARRALGYSLRNGEWMTQEDVMTRQGYRRYKGQWMNEQEIQLAERERQQDLAQKDWFRKISQWRDWLGTERHDAGFQNLNAINDPAAVKALAMALDEDPRASARRVYIDILGRIGGPAALESLAVAAVQDPVVEVRLSCLDALKPTHDPAVVTYFVRQLRHKKNEYVRRAAVGLAAMGDPSAIKPLIEALVTEHKYLIKGSGGSGSISASFGSGGSGLSMGGGPKYRKELHRNQECLDALVLLTGGANFQFDLGAWKTWYNAQNRRATLEGTAQP